MRRVVMSDNGRVTVPVEARRELGIEGVTEFEIEVDRSDDSLILRPAVVLRREDAWAYSPDHRKMLARAHKDSRAGRVRKMTEKELSEMAD